MATIIINIGLTMLALTAACPRTKAPTIPIVGPIGEGTLSPASRINSKIFPLLKFLQLLEKEHFHERLK